ncbi:MAG: response regulator [Flavobacteriaceae bacterium]
METYQILWVDDEVDHLQSHILYLKGKGYHITPCSNGVDALKILDEHRFDAVLLDENMPGLNGLETLEGIKQKNRELPVIMITKNEEEQIMEEAIGSKISDYLIKPVNPNQILLSLKKNISPQQIIAEKTQRRYQQEFGTLTQELNNLNSWEDWQNYFQKLLFWELELEQTNDSALHEILQHQKKEANHLFGRFVEQNYRSWIQGNESPLLSHQLFQKAIVPCLQDDRPTLLVVIDNLRYDQWKRLEPIIGQIYNKTKELSYCSLLPTATQYARNALFAGLLPNEIQRQSPQYWKFDFDEGGKNLFEKELLETQWKRLGIAGEFSYHKILQLKQSQQLLKSLNNHRHEKLTVIVYNFVDMLSHAKTEMELIKELAPDEKAYRSLTQTWFDNSPLLEIIKKAKTLGFQLLLTTDHGTINVENPSDVIGDRNTSLNLRYKAGKSLTYQEKHVISCDSPEEFGLPAAHLNSKYIFAKDRYYFIYPNNHAHYAQFFHQSFQHGGVSMEEMIIPFVQFNA